MHLFAPVATGPIVSGAQAEPNNGKKPSKLSASSCQFFKDLANSDSDKSADAYAKGDKLHGRDYQIMADEDYKVAHDGGCGWASRQIPPWYRRTSGVILSGGGSSLA